MNLYGIAVAFFKRQKVVPFDTAFGCVAVYNGLAGILGWGLTNDIFLRGLGPVLASVFNLAYIVAGSSQFLGIGLNKRHVEAFGVIILMMSLLVRTMVLFYVMGFDQKVVNSYFFSAAFFVAALVRLVNLIQRQVLVVTQDVKLS